MASNTVVVELHKHIKGYTWVVNCIILTPHPLPQKRDVKQPPPGITEK
jgi:hypothetical protein